MGRSPPFPVYIDLNITSTIRYAQISGLKMVFRRNLGWQLPTVVSVSVDPDKI